MYLRFVTPQQDDESHSLQGVFAAAYALRDSHDLEPHEDQLLEASLAWYRTHLLVPDCLKEPDNHRAICWFTDQAKHSLQRIWDLISLLKEKGVQVSLVTTNDPGVIVYQDTWQVVAKPPRKRAKRVGT